MHDKVKEILAQLQDPTIKGLVKKVCTTHYSELITQPAACGNHHAYEGGLLDHLHSTGMLAGKICDHYPDLELNRDVAVAGAFLHDIGKVECYKEAPEDSKQKYRSTRASLLFHHIPIGFYIVRSVYDRMPKSRRPGIEDVDGILHIIISHHGRKEYSSPRTPRTDEARIAAEADFIDAYLSAAPGCKGMYGK